MPPPSSEILSLVLQSFREVLTRLALVALHDIASDIIVSSHNGVRALTVRAGDELLLILQNAVNQEVSLKLPPELKSLASVLIICHGACGACFLFQKPPQVIKRSIHAFAYVAQVVYDVAAMLLLALELWQFQRVFVFGACAEVAGTPTSFLLVFLHHSV